MKFMLLAAAALLAGPAIAQTTGGAGPVGPDAKTPAGQTMSPQTTPPAPAGQTMPDQTMPAPAPMDPQSQTPPPAPMNDPSTMSPAPATPMAQPGGSMTTGGYAPNGTPTPGTFQQAPSPAEAFPAPAPLAQYPICKKGQYDKCMQRGGR